MGWARGGVGGCRWVDGAASARRRWVAAPFTHLPPPLNSWFSGIVCQPQAAPGSPHQQPTPPAHTSSPHLPTRVQQLIRVQVQQPVHAVGRRPPQRLGLAKASGAGAGRGRVVARGAWVLWGAAPPALRAASAAHASCLAGCLCPLLSLPGPPPPPQAHVTGTGTHPHPPTHPLTHSPLLHHELEVARVPAPLPRGHLPCAGSIHVPARGVGGGGPGRPDVQQGDVADRAQQAHRLAVLPIVQQLRVRGRWGQRTQGGKGGNSTAVAVAPSQSSLQVHTRCPPAAQLPCQPPSFLLLLT